MKEALKFLCEYLEKFALENEDWENGKSGEQLRAIFTTICLIGKIDADTDRCDRLLGIIYWLASLEKIVEREVFDNFMLEHIV